jgi:hypothetical protein
MAMSITRWFQNISKQNILPVESKQLKPKPIKQQKQDLKNPVRKTRGFGGFKPPQEIPKDERPYGQKWLERRQAYIDYHKELDQRLKDAIARL